MEEQLTKTQQKRLDQQRMVDSIKLGWSREEIMKFWNWSAYKYEMIFRLVMQEISDFIKESQEPLNLDDEIMKTFLTSSKEPKVKKFVDPRTGKEYADVTEFYT